MSKHHIDALLRRQRSTIFWLPALILAALLAAALAVPVLAHPNITEDGGAPVAPAAPDLSQAELLAISASLGEANPGFHAQEQDGRAILRDAQGSMQATVSPQGLAVTAGGQLWKLSLVAAGYGNELHPVAPGIQHGRANRVEVQRGALTEWYVNGPMGVEQGFTLDKAPAGRGTDAPLTLELQSQGGTLALEDTRSLTVHLPGTAGTLRYTGLVAVDARGRQLLAWLELGPAGTLRIAVDDRKAFYPLTIDPLIEFVKLTAPTQQGAGNFGSSVAVDDDIVVVGMPMSSTVSSGAVYVFARTPGTWQVNTTPIATLTASNPTIGDGLGFSVALDGDTIVAGAPYASFSGQGAAGVAYVFVKPGGGWATGTETTKLVAASPEADAGFGEAVAIDGDTVVVGAYAADIDPGTGIVADAGAAYVFVKQVGDWVQDPIPSTRMRRCVPKIPSSLRLSAMRWRSTA